MPKIDTVVLNSVINLRRAITFLAQHKTIHALVTDKFRDNDLKYRYVQMRGEATHDELQKLRENFDFNRNKDSIKIIRRQVEKYEQLVKEQTESAARAHLNATQAEHL